MKKTLSLLLCLLSSAGLFACVSAIVPVKSPPIPPKKVEIHATKSGSPRWIFKTKERIVSTPAVGADGTIYVTTLDRSLYAINSKGKTKWPKPFKTDEIVLSSPATAIDGTGTVYVTSKDRNLYAVVSGKERWRFTTGGEIDSSPWVTSQGNIYVASQDFNLYAITPDGKKLWENPYQAFDKFKKAMPEVGPDSTIYIGSQDGVLHAISSKGQKKWAKKVCDKITSSAKTDSDGNVFVGCWDGYLRSFHSNGNLRWKFKTGSSGDDSDSNVMGKAILSRPYVDSSGTLYFGSDDGYLYALDSKTGKEKWKFHTGKYVKKKGSWVRIEGTEGYIQASVVVGPNGKIYFGSVNEYFYCLNKEGELQWQFDAMGWVDKAPRIGRGSGNNFVIYLAAGKHLYALNP